MWRGGGPEQSGCHEWSVKGPTTETPQTELVLIPRQVRDKLDRAGIKLHLKEWELMTTPERAHLCDLPCTSAEEVARYTVEVDRLVRCYTGNPAQRLKPPA